MSETIQSCPHCGSPVAVVLVAPASGHRSEQHSNGDGADTIRGDMPIARPWMVHRNVGAEREQAWGVLLETPVEPGSEVQIVAKSGKSWVQTVDESLGAAPRGGYR